MKPEFPSDPVSPERIALAAKLIAGEIDRRTWQIETAKLDNNQELVALLTQA